jgi:O-antigen/teichoic acid export membrane protein
VQAWQLRPAVSLSHPVGTMLGEHWSLGRWMLLTNAITLLTVQAMPWTLGYFHGKGEVAEFGALAQVMGLTNPVIIGIAGLIVPAVAATSPRRGVAAARHVALSYALQGAILLLPYYAVVMFLPELSLRFITHKPEYAGLGTYLRLFVVAYMVTFPAQVMQSLLNGLGRTRSTFVAQCAFSTATLLVSLPLAAVYGLAGAVWSGVIPALAFVITSVVMLRRAAAGRAAHEPKAVLSSVADAPATPSPARAEGAVA